MSQEQVLYQSPLLYRVLREEDGTLLIEVVVGGTAMSYGCAGPGEPDGEAQESQMGKAVPGVWLSECHHVSAQGFFTKP